MSATCIPSLSPETVLAHLSRYRFRFSSELDLQDGLETALVAAKLQFEREKILGPGERADFLIDGGIAMEVKIKGSLSEAIRQVNRYANHGAVSAIILIGSCAWLTKLPPEIGGKPLYRLRLLSSLL
jgi:hypothetical protein